MLTEVKAYSSSPSAPTLLLSDTGRAETDLIQIRNIEGLDPVKASINTSPLGDLDGVSHVGSNVPSRNIVLTIHPNPDWNVWSFESLRRLIYTYFMPKQLTRLVFYSDDILPVEISGIVESVEANLFSKDPEFLVSIICPDPYFTALDPIILTGQTLRPEDRVDGEVEVIDYIGTIPTGFYVKVIFISGSVPTVIGIHTGDIASPIVGFTVNAGVSGSLYFEMNSISMKKFVQNVNIGAGVIDNLLSEVHEDSLWPILLPGENKFSVITDVGVQDWELIYFEKFGGL